MHLSDSGLYRGSCAAPAGDEEQLDGEAPTEEQAVSGEAQSDLVEALAESTLEAQEEGAIMMVVTVASAVENKRCIDVTPVSL